MKPTILPLLMVFALATPALADTPMAPSAEAVAAAHTPAEHEALAAAYAKEASDLRAAAARHRAMDKEYSAPGYRSLKLGAALHCKKLVDSYEAAATEADSLAAAQREAAAGAKAK
jgi:hypothetical protein